uniref:Response regulator n=1 Tax=Chryseobacterium endophyticum TaxID=1854762 RepID=A0AAU6WL60_9FLAO
MKNTLHACIIDDKDDGESISFLLKKNFRNLKSTFTRKTLILLPII